VKVLANTFGGDRNLPKQKQRLSRNHHPESKNLKVKSDTCEC
jgi:hypothetical protein